MGIYPKIKPGIKLLEKKTCTLCKKSKDIEDFVPVRSIFFTDGYSHICGECLDEILKARDYNWEYVDQACQVFSIPWLPTPWEEIRNSGCALPFSKYALRFMEKQYADFGWKEYYQQFCELRERDLVGTQMPRINQEELRQMREKWGHNYDDDALYYLENLYKGILKSQSVNGDLQVDQAIKICKASYEIDQRLQSGDDIKSYLDVYDKLIKQAEFTPQNTKDSSDFESCGELIKWLEENGWVNKYYDDVTRDPIDELMKNIQAFNQQLYTNEPGIGEDIDRRIEQIKTAHDLENMYGIGGGDFQEIEDYAQNSYEGLFAGTPEEEEEFQLTEDSDDE